MKYIVDSVPKDAFTRELEAEVQRVKNSAEWRLKYMTLEMRDRENVEKGMEQGIKAFLELCKEMGLSVNEALEKLRQKFSLSDMRANEYVQRFWG